MLTKTTSSRTLRRECVALRLQPPVSSVNPMQMAVRKKEPKLHVANSLCLLDPGPSSCSELENGVLDSARDSVGCVALAGASGEQLLAHKSYNLFRDVGRRLDFKDWLPCQRVHGDGLPFRSTVRLMQDHRISAVQKLPRRILEIFRISVQHS